MNTERLHKQILKYKHDLEVHSDLHAKEWQERITRREMYKAWTKSKLLNIDRDGLLQLLTPLWAMQVWGNKAYVIDKMIDKNTLPTLQKCLADLFWGEDLIATRWDTFRKTITGMGPAMISELLCHVHSDSCMIWNKRVYIGLKYLGIPGLPRHDYQVDGKRYEALGTTCQKIVDELRRINVDDPDLLAVDYFLWHECQIEEEEEGKSGKTGKTVTGSGNGPTNEFIHNDVRDKIRDIGQFLGFQADIEKKVAAGSKVDVVWESSIGNMGRVIYVFEVQTKGSIDSLLMNLLKSLNNPAVQGVVAVSDKDQLATIMKHAQGVAALREKLKYWDYTEVLSVHENLASVYESINKLELVPEGFQG